MAKKNKIRDQFVLERLPYLAMVHLTRRDDLRVDPATPDSGLDYLVEIEKNNVRVGRRFGLIVQGAWPTMTLEEINGFLRPVLKSFGQRHFLFPVAIFVFTMENEQAYFSWLAEPKVLQTNSLKLQLHKTAMAQPLNRQALNTVVNQVDAWYDAMIAEVAV